MPLIRVACKIYREGVPPRRVFVLYITYDRILSALSWKCFRRHFDTKLDDGTISLKLNGNAVTVFNSIGRRNPWLVSLPSVYGGVGHTAGNIEPIKPTDHQPSGSNSTRFDRSSGWNEYVQNRTYTRLLTTFVNLLQVSYESYYGPRVLFPDDCHVSSMMDVKRP